MNGRVLNIHIFYNYCRVVGLLLINITCVFPNYALFIQVLDGTLSCGISHVYFRYSVLLSGHQMIMLS